MTIQFQALKTTALIMSGRSMIVVCASIQGQDIAEAYLAEQSLRRSRNLSLRPTPFPDGLLLLKGQVF